LEIDVYRTFPAPKLAPVVLFYFAEKAKMTPLSRTRKQEQGLALATPIELGGSKYGECIEQQKSADYSVAVISQDLY
jgi:hypothetical protein